MPKPPAVHKSNPLTSDARVLRYLPQVTYIARRIHDRLPPQVPLADLVQAGVVGLLDALKRFDPGRHVQFASYAAFRIRGAILDSLREMDWSPRDLRRKARLVEETAARIEQETGRRASEHELAAALGMSLATFRHLLAELKGLDLFALDATPDPSSAFRWRRTCPTRTARRPSSRAFATRCSGSSLPPSPTCRERSSR